jgi:hypothetical protein
MDDNKDTTTPVGNALRYCSAKAGASEILARNSSSPLMIEENISTTIPMTL